MSKYKDADYNRPRFNAMEKLIKELFPSVVVLNPARHPDGLAYNTYMEYAMIDVKECDVMVQLNGWHNSPGAQKERAEAVNLGKNIIREENIWRTSPADIKTNLTLTKLDIRHTAEEIEEFAQNILL